MKILKLCAKSYNIISYTINNSNHHRHHHHNYSATCTHNNCYSELATISYRSGPEWELRFGRKMLTDATTSFKPQFEIEAYLDYQVGMVWYGIILTPFFKCF